MLIDPNSAPRVPDSPIQRSIQILDGLFSLGPQPAAKTEQARFCGELIGRHLLNLMVACGELNLSGFHSAAVLLFRPLEDALDCLGAVTLVAGAAERWQRGQLRPSDAARLWHERLRRRDPRSGEIISDYRQRLRSLFNNLAHCSPAVAFWDVFREPHASERDLFRFTVKHRGLIIESNAYRIDGYLIAHCLEFLQLVSLGYAAFLQSQSSLWTDLARLESEIEEILKQHLGAGSLESILPREMEVELELKMSADDGEATSVGGRWLGGWSCDAKQVENGVLRIEQQGRFLHGWLRTRVGRFDTTEELTGFVSERHVLLDGISSKFEPYSEEEYQYSLDSFELDLSEDASDLSGKHSCSSGAGLALFKRAR